MSYVARKERFLVSKPKVFSLFKTERFENRFPDVPILGEPVNLFVKCKSYNLMLPVNGHKERILDIFEETILRLIQLKKCSVDELAKLLCIKKDLINFILIRLNENGCLENNQTLSERGLNLLNMQLLKNEEVEFIQGKLFVIPENGLILPYIHVGEFQSESVDDFSNLSITFGVGTAGKYEKISGKCLMNFDHEKKVVTRIETSRLKKTIRIYNKIASIRHFSHINLCDGYAIDSSCDENIYFHLQAVVQDDNSDELIFSDGFVHNIDGMFSYVKNKDLKLYEKIKENAIEMQTFVNESGKAKGGRKDRNKTKKYDEIYTLYKNIKKHISSIVYDQAQIDTRTEINEGKRQIIIDCYYMLEWGLYYFTKKNQLSSEMLNLIKQQTLSDNAQTIMSFANNIGLQDVSKYKNLFSHIDSGKIYSVYNYNSPKLYVCLPLAIAEAKENSSSEVHVLIQKDRYFLRFINYLNDNCGNLRHDSEADAIEIDEKEIIHKTKLILNILLLDLCLKDEQTEDNQPEDELTENEQTKDKQQKSASQKRLLAQAKLTKRLGTIFFLTMPSGLQNDWIKISPDKHGEELPDAYEYVMILSRILEAELRDANKEFTGKMDKTKKYALKRIEQIYSGNIPKSFTKVGDNNYLKSCKEQHSTLGAEALVFIANLENRDLEKFKENNFVLTIDKVASLRGHGNVVALNEDEESLNQLRNEVIKLSKTIGGYYE